MDVNGGLIHVAITFQIAIWIGIMMITQWI